MKKTIRRGQFVTTLPKGRKVVGMTTHAGKVYVATEKNVYVLKGKKLIPLQFDITAPAAPARPA